MGIVEHFHDDQTEEDLKPVEDELLDFMRRALELSLDLTMRHKRGGQATIHELLEVVNTLKNPEDSQVGIPRPPPLLSSRKEHLPNRETECVQLFSAAFAFLSSLQNMLWSLGNPLHRRLHMFLQRVNFFFFVLAAPHSLVSQHNDRDETVDQPDLRAKTFGFCWGRESGRHCQ